jgi:hypothetical protein
MVDSVKVSGIADVQQALAAIPGEFRRAARNALNDTARDVLKHIEGEIPKVFHRPTRQVRRPFFLQKAEKDNLVAELRMKDVFTTSSGASVIENVLTPHIPGYPATRQSKSLEVQLRRKGLLGANQFLVPSRTMRLDRNGNVSGGQAQKMLADLNAYTYEGAPNATFDNKVRYIWGSVQPRNGKRITGIWLRARWQSRKPGALAMLVVDGAPQYRKRFRLHDTAQQHVDRVMPMHLQLAVEHAFRRAMT